MLDDYYDIVGWNKKTGIPEKSTLLGLGLQDVAAELEKMGKYS
jgi:aldehyde:ferredoxin oxidoreductase